ncbi:unnamed protein product, partial [Prorocentrum cordatum]
ARAARAAARGGGGERLVEFAVERAPEGHGDLGRAGAEGRGRVRAAGRRRAGRVRAWQLGPAALLLPANASGALQDPGPPHLRLQRGEARARRRSGAGAQPRRGEPRDGGRRVPGGPPRPAGRPLRGGDRVARRARGARAAGGAEGQAAFQAEGALVVPRRGDSLMKAVIQPFVAKAIEASQAGVLSSLRKQLALAGRVPAPNARAPA